VSGPLVEIKKRGGKMELTITKDRKDLERLEGVIQKNIGAFYEVGRALMEIRDRELYLLKNGGGFQTFEAYCKGAWDMSRRHAYRLMDSCSVIQAIKCDQLDTSPATESQTRPLSKLGPQQQREAWAKAVETAPEGKVTAAHVYKIVKEMTEPAPPPAPKAPPKLTPTIPEHAVYFATIAISQLERISDDDPTKDKALRKVITKAVSMLPEQEKPKSRKAIIERKVLDPEFKEAFDLIFVAIKNQIAMKWRIMSKEAALEYVNILKDVLEIQK